MEGEEESDGGFEDGADDGFWNIFLMSIFGLAGVAAADAGGVKAAEDEEEAAGGITGDLEDIEAFPLI